MKTKPSLLFAFFLIASLSAAWSQAGTWTGNGTDNNWATAANWSGNVAPNPASYETLTFPGGTTQTSTFNNLAGVAKIGRIYLSNSNTATGFTLAGNRIDPGWDMQATGSNATNTISLDLQIVRDFSFVTAYSSKTIVSGNISEAGGSWGITAQSTGILSLTGTNTFTGQLTVLQGTLRVNSVANGGTASAIGSGTGSINFNPAGSNAILDYTGTLAGGHSTDRAIALVGTNLGGTILANGAGPVAFTAPAVLFANGTANKTLAFGGASTAANTFDSAIGNESTYTTAVVKEDAGTWALGGANTFSGGVTVYAGTLLINGSSSGNGGLSVYNGATFGRTATTALTLGGNATFANGSKIELTLGNGVNSSLNRSSGTWSLATNQAFVFDLTNAVAGTYHILTGLAAVPTLAGWTWTSNLTGAIGTFAANGTTGVDFNLTTVPEPSTWALLTFSLTTVMVLRRRRS